MALNIRPTLGAAIWNFIAFILLWLALLQDVNHISQKNLELTPMVTYNMSSVGRDADSRYPASLAADIKALVPVADRDAPSVTRHLGGHDYYALYHFYICRGHYAVDDATNSLTHDRVDETCEDKPRSYIFDLHNELRRDIHPSVAGRLARADCPAGLRKFNAKASTAFLIIGLIFATLNLFLLPFTVTGSHRVNRPAAIIAFLAMISFIVGASIDTALARCAKNKGVGILASGYHGILWSGVAHSIFAFFFIIWEAFLEYWTPVGERITMYEKPKEADYRLWRGSRRAHQGV